MALTSETIAARNWSGTKQLNVEIIKSEVWGTGSKSKTGDESVSVGPHRLYPHKRPSILQLMLLLKSSLFGQGSCAHRSREELKEGLQYIDYINCSFMWNICVCDVLCMCMCICDSKAGSVVLNQC